MRGGTTPDTVAGGPLMGEEGADAGMYEIIQRRKLRCNEKQIGVRLEESIVQP